MSEGNGGPTYSIGFDDGPEIDLRLAIPPDAPDSAREALRLAFRAGHQHGCDVTSGRWAWHLKRLGLADKRIAKLLVLLSEPPTKAEARSVAGLVHAVEERRELFRDPEAN